MCTTLCDIMLHYVAQCLCAHRPTTPCSQCPARSSMCVTLCYIVLHYVTSCAAWHHIVTTLCSIMLHYVARVTCAPHHVTLCYIVWFMCATLCDIMFHCVPYYTKVHCFTPSPTIPVSAVNPGWLHAAASKNHTGHSKIKCSHPISFLGKTK